MVVKSKMYDYQKRVVSRVDASLFSFTALLFSADTSVDQEAPASCDSHFASILVQRSADF